MKSLLSKWLKLSASVLFVFSTIACQNPADSHAHTYSSTWSSDDEYHWHAATCEHSSEKSDKASHSWDSGEIISAATCTEKGSVKYTCTVCAKIKTVKTSEKGHSYNDGVVTKTPTCTEKGEKTFTCSVCNGTKKEDIPATGHSYNKGEVTKAATCAEKGEKTFTCSVCNGTKKENIPATGHNYDGIKCSSCGGYSVTISEIGTDIVDSSKTDGMKLKVNTLTHTVVNGYNTYSVNYTLTNEIEGSEIGPGIFKIIYKTSSGYDSSFQTGAFNNLYYNDTITRSYSWKLTSDKTFVCIEYIPDSKMSSYIFTSTVTNNLLNFVPAE